MGKTKIAITLDEQYIEQLDRFVSEHIFQNRSQAIQEAVEEKTCKDETYPFGERMHQA